MSEIQIGLSKNARPTYSLDDVALVPTRRTRRPAARRSPGRSG